MRISPKRSLIGIFILSIFISLFSGMSVHAYVPINPSRIRLDEAGQVNCFTRLNGKREVLVSQDDQNFYTLTCINSPSVGGNCTKNNGIYECTNPIGQIGEDMNEANINDAVNTYGTAVAQAMCGNDGNAGELATCRNQWRNNYVGPCLRDFYTGPAGENYYQSSGDVFPNLNTDYVANCIAQRSGGNAADIAAALAGGATDAEDNVDENTAEAAAEVERLEAEACEARGGMWVPQEEGQSAHCEYPKSCDIQMAPTVGWMSCTVLWFFADVTDKIYGILIQQFLVLPNMSNNPALNNAWGATLSIANVAFVIAFLFVIYSQITGMGISNYGIKKMLPKLVVGAILINLSFWICALAVDLSNIAGVTIYGMLRGVLGASIIPVESAPWSELTYAMLAGGGIVAIAGVATFTMAPGLASGLLIALVPALIGAIIAIIVSFVIIALRQGLAVILTILAPLAFAAALLPNTENWFDRWKKLFITVLVFYPLFAVVFGGAQVAGNVLVQTSGVDGVAAQIATGQPEDEGNVVVSLMLLIIGLLVMVLPLFAAPFLWKYSGGMLVTIAGKLNNSGGGMTGAINKWAGDTSRRKLGMAGASTQASLANLAAGGGKHRRKNPMRHAARFFSGAGKRADEQATRNAQYAESQAYSQAMNDPGMVKKAAGTYGSTDVVKARAEKALDDLQLKEVKTQKARIRNAGFSDMNQVLAVANGGRARTASGEQFDGSSDDVRLAAMEYLADNKQYSHLNQAWDTAATQHNTSSQTDIRFRRRVADTMQRSSSRPSYMSPDAFESMRQGSLQQVEGDGSTRSVLPTSSNLIDHAINTNEYSADKIAGAHPNELRVVTEHVNIANADDHTNVTAEGREQFYRNAAAVLDPASKLDKKAGASVPEIENLLRGNPYGLRETLDAPSTTPNQSGS